MVDGLIAVAAESVGTTVGAGTVLAGVLEITGRAPGVTTVAIGKIGLAIIGAAGLAGAGFARAGLAGAGLAGTGLGLEDAGLAGLGFVGTGLGFVGIGLGEAVVGVVLLPATEAGFGLTVAVAPGNSLWAGKRTTSRHFGHLILRPKTSVGTVKEAEQLGHATLTLDMTQLSWSDTKKRPIRAPLIVLVYLISPPMPDRCPPE
ncbi:MAG: hypothetical protein JNK57_08765 [Planctomycetaceae bacterium]|nr:hypothetical protein [Planctomycetaceae bacterium]